MAKAGGNTQSYDEHREVAAERSRALSLAGRDIAPLPPVVNPHRRASCRDDFRLFCETYFPAVFALDWSDDHLKVIDIIENATLEGGLFAVAMPRGSGKTSLAICAAEWALLYGHRSFIVLIGASEDAAADLLDHVKADFESNDTLNEDFPEVCYPIRQLDGITHRAAGQLLDGERTQIYWTAKELILPTVPGSCSSGAAVKVAGITGRIRGLSIQRPSDGAKIRPDFVLIDDPQTDESARSPKQVRDRLTTLSGAILGLAGPGKKIAGVMPCTVISKGDMADAILDRKLNPQWQGQRIKMLKSLPTDTKLWEEYAERRANSLREGRGIVDATAFYKANQAAMDAGAVAGWAARFNADELSAIQHAMNLKLQSDEAFHSEYQNEPLALEGEAPLLLKAEQVTSKATNLGRGVVPNFATRVTAMVDVQGEVLFYAVLATGSDFTAHVIDYGTYPEQGRIHFTLRELNKTLAMVKKGVGLEGRIYDGLDKLTARLLSRSYTREDGGEMHISRCMVDANWGESTSVVKQFCRASKYASLLLPSHGKGITADRKSMNEYAAKPGERAGWHWRVYPKPDAHVMYDTNSWKTFVAQRIVTGMGEAGNLSLFQATPNRHRMFAEHLTAEYPTPTEGMGRLVNVWRCRPNRENHYLDCVVGAFVAASEQGALFVGHQPATGASSRRRRRLEATF